MIPTYGAGRPSPFKMFPFVLGVLIFIGCTIARFLDGDVDTIQLCGSITFGIVICVTCYFMYLRHDDDGNSNFLFFKPWIYKLK